MSINRSLSNEKEWFCINSLTMARVAIVMYLSISEENVNHLGGGG